MTGCNPGVSFLGGSGDGGPALDAYLYLPYGVAVDAAGNIFVADAGGCRIRRVNATSGIITTIAGGNGGDPNATTICNYNGDNIPATLATLSDPQGVTVDDSGNIYIADVGNQRIRRIDSTTGLMTTVAGTGVVGYNEDNIPATSATLSTAPGVAVDNAGNLYIADNGNHRIRRVDSATGVITTVAGNGYIGPDGYGGFSGDGGLATSAELNQPYDVALDTAGNLYIADLGNERVRVVNSIHEM